MFQKFGFTVPNYNQQAPTINYSTFVSNAPTGYLHNLVVRLFTENEFGPPRVGKETKPASVSVGCYIVY